MGKEPLIKKTNKVVDFRKVKNFNFYETKRSARDEFKNGKTESSIETLVDKTNTVTTRIFLTLKNETDEVIELEQNIPLCVFHVDIFDN